jgi:hypothetical protein
MGSVADARRARRKPADRGRRAQLDFLPDRIAIAVRHQCEQHMEAHRLERQDCRGGVAGFVRSRGTRMESRRAGQVIASGGG